LKSLNSEPLSSRKCDTTILMAKFLFNRFDKNYPTIA